MYKLPQDPLLACGTPVTGNNVHQSVLLTGSGGGRSRGWKFPPCWRVNGVSSGHRECCQSNKRFKVPKQLFLFRSKVRSAITNASPNSYLSGNNQQNSAFIVSIYYRQNSISLFNNSSFAFWNRVQRILKVNGALRGKLVWKACLSNKCRWSGISTPKSHC